MSILSVALPRQSLGEGGPRQFFAQRALRLLRLQSQDQQIEERKQQRGKSEPDAGDPKEKWTRTGVPADSRPAPKL